MPPAPAPPTVLRAPTARRTPIVLPPAPREGEQSTRTFTVWNPTANSGMTRQALSAVRWWHRISDADAFGAGRFMSAYVFMPLHEVVRGDSDVHWEAALASGASKDVLVASRDRYRHVARVGADPMVLLALRGSRLTAAQRLLVARSGLTPTEAHDLVSRGALDLDAVAALTALRTT